MTVRVILPAEATVEMIAAFWRQKNTGTQDIGEAGDATSDFDAYTSMLAASPASGKVTEAEMEKALNEFIRVWGTGGKHISLQTDAMLAALASLGLDVG